MSRDRLDENLSRLLGEGNEDGLDREGIRRLTMSVLTAWRSDHRGLAPDRVGWERSGAYTWLSERLKHQPLAYLLPFSAGLVGLLYTIFGPAGVRVLAIVLGGS